MRDFDEWSVDKAFSSEYFPHVVSCQYCLSPKSNAHMCVYNRSEIVKMQECTHTSGIILGNYGFVCSSCFINCEPKLNFVKKVKKSLKLLRRKLLTFIDEEFTEFFCRHVFKYLIKVSTLTCVSCSLSLHDYRWTTFEQLTSAYRKRRLEST